jgi:hypothetical protein
MCFVTVFKYVSLAKRVVGRHPCIELLFDVLKFNLNIQDVLAILCAHEFVLDLLNVLDILCAFLLCRFGLSAEISGGDGRQHEEGRRGVRLGEPGMENHNGARGLGPLLPTSSFSCLHCFHCVAMVAMFIGHRKTNAKRQRARTNIKSNDVNNGFGLRSSQTPCFGGHAMVTFRCP